MFEKPIFFLDFVTLLDVVEVTYNVDILGSILEGPDAVQLKPIVEEAMPMLIALLKDQSVVVRDTAAWTVGRVCDLIPEAVISEKTLPPLLHSLVEGLNAEPRVAANVCWVTCLIFL